MPSRRTWEPRRQGQPGLEGQGRLWLLSVCLPVLHTPQAGHGYPQAMALAFQPRV